VQEAGASLGVWPSKDRAKGMLAVCCQWIKMHAGWGVSDPEHTAEDWDSPSKRHKVAMLEVLVLDSDTEEYRSPL